VIAKAFADGLAHARAGRYFEAHEAFEEAWRAAEPEERDFFQGLVHVVVAWYQGGRGNRVGCERQLEKAQRRLAAFAPHYRGIDVASLLEQVGGATPDHLPRLDLSEADGVEQPP
jgi:predicted metal-dependent hydrolase